MKSIYYLLIFSLLFIGTLHFGYAASSISNEVNNIQGSVPSGTPSAPSGMLQKGYVGSLLEKLFNPSNDRIYWNYIDFRYSNIESEVENGLGLNTSGGNNVGNNVVPKWSSGRFVNANIYSVGGNIGIGASNPTQRLQVNGNISTNHIYGQSNGSYKYVSGGSAHNAGGNILMYGSNYTTNPVRNADIFFRTNDNYRLSIDGSTGNVGIGTTNPLGTLDVRGTTVINATSNYDIWLQGGTTTSGGNARNLGILGIKSTDELRFNYGGEYSGGIRMQGGQVVMDGNVGIGTTSPSYRLQVNGDTQIGGRLGLGQNPLPGIRLSVNGHIRTPNQVRANMYCDVNGNNCISEWPVIRPIFRCQCTANGNDYNMYMFGNDGRGGDSLFGFMLYKNNLSGRSCWVASDANPSGRTLEGSLTCEKQ